MSSTTPASLIRFGDELERAIRSELSSATAPRVPGRRQQKGLRLALATTGAVSAALAIGSSLVPRRAESRWVRNVVVLASQVLAPSPRTILHTVVTAKATDGDGRMVSTWSENGWTQQGPPWRQREIVQVNEGPVLEGGDDGHVIVDRTHDQIYTAPRRLATRPHPSGAIPPPWSVAFAQQLRGLLSSGDAQVTRSKTSDGAPAIEIAVGGDAYYVDPANYKPLEIDYRGYTSDGIYHRDGVTRFRFGTYQLLPLAGHGSLLELTPRHGARVDPSRADYWNATRAFVPPA